MLRYVIASAIKMPKASVSILSFLWLTGCALQSDQYRGIQALHSGEYGEAVSYLQKALAESPDDMVLRARLGIAYCRNRQYDKALSYLEETKQLVSQYPEIQLYLGRVYEEQGRISEAIQEYLGYSETVRPRSKAMPWKVHAHALARQLMRKEVLEAVQREAMLPVVDTPADTIAVLYFTNLSQREDLDPFEKGLTNMLITDLGKVEALKVVERERLELLLQELNLSQSQAMAPDTRARIAGLLGVRQVLDGQFMNPLTEALHIQAFSTDTSTAELVAEAEAMGEVNQFIQLEKKLVLSFLDAMDIVLTQAERDAIQRVPTESLLALQAYFRGLDYRDRGMYQQAGEALHQAVEADPNFTEAQELRDEMHHLVETPVFGTLDESRRLEDALEDTGVRDDRDLPTTSMLESIGQATSGEFAIDPSVSNEQRSNPYQRDRIVEVSIQW